MERLSTAENAFIRPSPAGDSLGGVSRKTRESILLVEAAGYDTVLVETVGVGQSEIAVHSMTDVFVLLLLPGAGDELQGIKRGIVEMADLLVVNKSDGDKIGLANQARAHYINALHHFPARESGWSPEVLACSALEGQGMDLLWERLLAFKSHLVENHHFEKKRSHQAKFWLKDAIQNGLSVLFEKHAATQQLYLELEHNVLIGKLSPFSAAAQVLDFFEKNR
jgi:LAO/AO transport system kinase